MFALEFAEGFASVPLGAIRLLLDRAFVGRLKLPLLVNVLAFAGIFVGLFVGGGHLGRAWVGLDASASWLADFAALFIALLVTWQIGPVIVETVVSPFLDGLAEATERAHTGRPMPAVGPGLWVGIVTGARSSARLLLLQLLLLPFLILLALTGIGAPLAFLVSAWLCALVWFDIPCARRHLGLAERRDLLRRNWARALGFGAAFQIGVLLPVFNLLLLTPAAAIAVTTLFFRCDRAVANATVDAPPRSNGASGPK